jgi:AraC-like DNA-binding protein
MANRSAEVLRELTSLIATFPEGSTATCVPSLQVVRRSRPTAFSSGVISPSFCLIVQGSKRIRLGSRTFDYGPGDFLTALIDVPAAGHVLAASPQRPYLGLRVDLTTEDIVEVVTEAGLSMSAPPAQKPEAAFVGRAGLDLLEVFLRLVQLFDRPREAAFLSSLHRRELVYRLLTGEHGHLFLKKALFDPRANGVAGAIGWIRTNFASPLSMSTLARANGLSVSGLHHKFKAITTLSPLQYQKQLRLQEARRLMLGGVANAGIAASRVGYESQSQFTREYRRQFGLPPRADIEAMRRTGAPAVQE